MRKKLLTLLPALLCAQAAMAGAPLKINFQGRLTESGQPAQGTKSFVFKIYSAVSGGVPVWTGPAQSVALSGGVFSAELSAGTPALSTATFAGARYVEMIVDGVVLSPRQEMMSAPYALVAQALAADADVPPAAIAAGSLTDYHVALTTAAIGAGRFADDRVLITTGAFAALNGADQLVKLDSSGNLPALDGSALTGVAAASYSGNVAVSQLAGVINDSRVAISTGAFPGGFNAANQLAQLDGSGLLPAANVPNLSASKITSGKFYDAQLAVSTGAFPGGFNAANQLAQLDGSGLLPVANVPGLSAAKITSGKFYDAQLAVSTGAFPGGFNAANQLAQLDGSARFQTGRFAAGLTLPMVTVSALSYNVTSADSTIFANGLNNAVAIYLPSAVGIAGRIYTIKSVDSTNAVTIVPVSGETLEGWPNTSPFPLATSGDFITCQSDGANWQIIGGYSMTMMATGFAY